MRMDHIFDQMVIFFFSSSDKAEFNYFSRTLQDSSAVGVSISYNKFNLFNLLFLI